MRREKKTPMGREQDQERKIISIFEIYEYKTTSEMYYVVSDVEG